MIDLGHLTDQRRSRIEQVLAHRQPDVTVVMENIGDFHNIAAVMRTCDAVGIQNIYILNTDQALFDIHTKGFKSSRSANRWVTIHQYSDLEKCVKDLKEKYNQLICTHLSDASINLYDMDFAAQSMAIVFGNEQKGISEEMLSCCDGSFVIPQVGMIKSLNISVACAVTLYEAFRQKQIAGHYTMEKISIAEKMPLLEKWSQKIR